MISGGRMEREWVGLPASARWSLGLFASRLKDESAAIVHGYPNREAGISSLLGSRLQVTKSR